MATLNKIIIIAIIIMLGLWFVHSQNTTLRQAAESVQRLDQCHQKAKNNLLKTFQIMCAVTESSDSGKNGCYNASYDDMKSYITYATTIAPKGDMAKLWNNYEKDISECATLK